jgi:hypothetical protein
MGLSVAGSGQVVQLMGWLTIGVNVMPTAAISPRASMFTTEPSGETAAYQ